MINRLRVGAAVLLGLALGAFLAMLARALIIEDTTQMVVAGFTAASLAATQLALTATSQPVPLRLRPGLAPGRISAPDPHLRKMLAVEQGYDRAAGAYDCLGEVGERLLARPWRDRQWEFVTGREIIELGVGTGHNFAYYPPGARVTGIDLSVGMLGRARSKAGHVAQAPGLLRSDAHSLPFASATFDCVVSSFTLCSIADPQLALREAARVLRPGGRLVLLEHGLSRRPMLRFAIRAFNVVSERLYGDNMAQEHHRLLGPSDWTILHDEDLFLSDMVRLVVAEKPRPDIQERRRVDTR